jgi:NitT/TauT family transport system ATP-binding protein/sulfonate transport system ATP-binding protein
MTTLKIEQVSRTFPARHGNAPTKALEPTDLTIGNNDFVTILGPSGCGKSTLLRIVAAPAPTAAWCSSPTRCFRG